MTCHTIRKLVLALFIAASLMFNSRTLAQSSPADDQQIDQRIDELEKTLRALQQTIGELNRPSPGKEPTRITVPAPPATLPASPTTLPSVATDDPIARIRDEGLNRSQVMATLSYLTDVIGPRLTGSPNLHRANEWTRDRLTSWGLVNAHLEAWGPFGRGWSLKRFSAQIIEPQDIPLVGYPKAWSPGFDKPLVAPVVYLDTKTDSDLEKYKGKLKGAIVLTGAVRQVQARFDAPATRVSDFNLLQLANADARELSPAGQARSMTAAERRATFLSRMRDPLGRASTRPGDPATTMAATMPTSRPGSIPPRMLSFLAKEGAALIVNPSLQGDGGTFFIASASVAGPETPPASSATASAPATSPSARNFPQPWAIDAPRILPQITLNVEDYNRLVRMIQQGEKLKMAVELEVQYYSDDLMAYNTIAEIPGSDLKDQIVMLGAHMDSWHSGTGATDNGAGVAAVMEAVRILKAAKIQPRRTIRIALWTGEEQGLLGSKAYVAKHFGSYPDENATTQPTTRPSRRRGPITRPATAASQPARKLTREAEYEKLSVYFNLDNGTGKIRGVYMQGNEAVRPIFRRWLAPFGDLDAQTLSLSNTGGTDHQSFDAIGLPGFQFIQDPIEYWSRSHHSNADVFDRIQGDDLKQASTIIAAFVYDAAMADEKLPRKNAEDSR